MFCIYPDRIRKKNAENTLQGQSGAATQAVLQAIRRVSVYIETIADITVNVETIIGKIPSSQIIPGTDSRHTDAPYDKNPAEDVFF